MGFTEIYERIKLAANCRTQVELAELLNIRQSSTRTPSAAILYRATGT